MEKVRGSEIRCVFSSSEYSKKLFFDRGSAPDPAGEAYDAPPLELKTLPRLTSRLGRGDTPSPYPSCYNPNCYIIDYLASPCFSLIFKNNDC